MRVICLRTIVLLVGLFPSTGFSQSSLSGVWKNDQFGHSMVLQLNKDGSGAFDGESLGYTVKGNSLIVITGGETTAYTFSLSGNKLTLSGGDMEGRVVFSRDEGGSSASFSNTSQDLIGLWSGEGEMIEFKADGNCRYNGTLLPYRVANGRLILETTVGDVIFEYAIKEGNLVLQAGGIQSVYSRPAGASPVTPARAGEKHPPELVGQWCYMNMTSNSQSSRCITLREDGTYSYTSESSRSVNTNDFSGGTSSQGGDSGTWYVDGNRIYYQSPSAGNGSYLLEKRNHPKNVNDPMIVLDGEPFVTTTVRPPWR